MIAGVDGCRAGWVVALSDDRLLNISVRVVPTFAGLFAPGRSAPEVVAVDIPIGLSEKDSRHADIEARALLGHPRRSSVFAAPLRHTLDHMLDSGRTAYNHYPSVNAWCRANVGCGIAKQAWGIYPKVIEVDLYMRASRDRRVFEVHPELAFMAMTGSPMAASKRRPAGVAARLEALTRCVGPHVAELTPPRGAKIDDLYDALAALWTASRIASGAARRIPALPQTDVHGLDMAMWY